MFRRSISAVALLLSFTLPTAAATIPGIDVYRAGGAEPSRPREERQAGPRRTFRPIGARFGLGYVEPLNSRTTKGASSSSQAKGTGSGTIELFWPTLKRREFGLEVGVSPIRANVIVSLQGRMKIDLRDRESAHPYFVVGAGIGAKSGEPGPHEFNGESTLSGGPVAHAGFGFEVPTDTRTFGIETRYEVLRVTASRDFDSVIHLLKVLLMTGTRTASPARR